MHRMAITAMAMMAVPATAQPGWTGTYVFDADLGRDGAGQGNAIGVEHRLILGGRDGCRLTANGFQSNEAIRCTATPTAKGLRIAFSRYGDGGMKNRYGVAQYKPGATLFILTRGRRGVVTTWGAYEPDGIKGRSGSYFRRA